MLLHNDAPEWTTYPDVLTGYRPVGGTYLQLLGTLFTLHTEMLNAWTMILASLFSSLGLGFAVSQGVHGVDMVVFTMFWLSAIIHMPASVGYHLFMPMSLQVCNYWRRLDIMCIFAVSVPLCFCTSYYVFSLYVTCSLTFLASCVASWAISKVHKLQDGQALENSKHAMFIGTIVFLYYLPIAYQGLEDFLKDEYSVSILVATLLPLNLGFGAWAFAVGFPQVYAPGRFDLVGHSHQVMHVTVVVAHVLEYLFVYSNYRKTESQFFLP
jgi:adiponectin receptor